MHVLVVEDDTLLGQGIQDALARWSHTSDWVRDGAAALAAARAGTFDIAVLDLGLPRVNGQSLDGMGVLNALRRDGIGLPILIVTARDTVSDRIGGLDAGADDYLVKPFHLDELAARLRALHRRANGLAHSLVEVGALTLDTTTFEGSYAGQRLDLSHRIPAVACSRRTRRTGRPARNAGAGPVWQQWRRKQRSRSARARAAPKTLARSNTHGTRPGLSAGHGKSVMRSLRSRISVLVLAVIVVVLVPVVTLSYYFMIGEVDELSDARLAQNARTIHALVADTGASAAVVAHEIVPWQREQRSLPSALPGHSYETQIGFQYWNDAHALLLHSANLREVAFDAAPIGFADISIGPHRWRVFTLLNDDQSQVRVGERYDSRREISHALAIEAIVPFAIGLPLLALLVGWAVRVGLRPLRALADQLVERRPDNTQPLAIANSPREMEPVIAALNGLLERVRGLLRHERQFTANAAHELRTPLAGALMHVENAQAAANAAIATEALDKAGVGLARLTRIVNQMLDLARWDAVAATHEFRAVDLRRCVDEELQELGALAADKDIEFAISSTPRACFVDGWEPGLRALLRNLLDNAIRYSFAGGRVTISIVPHENGTRLSIADHGPGVEPTRRGAMFERFQRGAEGLSEGSGLGLSIVARIAELHHARVTLADADAHAGLRVDIDFLRPSTGP